MTVITTNTDVTALDLCCGHRVYLADSFIKQRKSDHKTWYCNVCAGARWYPGKSDIEKLRGQLSSTQDMLDTMRNDRDRKEYQRRAEKAAKTRIKNRVAKGVCPCCSRSFQNLGRHMQSKHPDYTKQTIKEPEGEGNGE